jgi:hypothetical protein
VVRVEQPRTARMGPAEGNWPAGLTLCDRVDMTRIEAPSWAQTAGVAAPLLVIAVRLESA